MFDIVIPYIEKDASTIHSCVNSCYKHVRNFENIYIVSATDPNVPETKWVNEKQIFTIEDILKINNKIPKVRAGWYLQQMIKLYVFQKIPELKDFCLILDSDVVFQNTINFFTEENIPLYTMAEEYHKPYFDIMPKLNPCFERSTQSSGVAHMCLFNRSIINDIHSKIKQHTNKSLIEAVLTNIEDSELYGSGFSEYELYYHYIHKFHEKEFKIRNLRYRNIFNHDPNVDYSAYCDYLADHSWGRK